MSEHQADFSGCEVVVQERIVNQRLTAAPIEARAGAALWTEDGRLTHYSACQGAHPTRDLLAAIFGLEHGDVRVVVPDVGGGFGAKSRTYPEELCLGWYARELGRPVKWAETRSENVMAMPQGRGQVQYAKLGGTSDGRITAYQLDVFQDAGAYPIIGAVLAGMTHRMATGTYEIPNVGFTAITTVTNKVSTTAYRGAGRPEAAVAIERILDRYRGRDRDGPCRGAAHQPRRRGSPSRTPPGSAPCTTSATIPRRCAGRSTPPATTTCWPSSSAAARAATGPCSASASACTWRSPPAGRAASSAPCELLPDGRVRVVSGATPYGQGHETTWAMIVADRTGIPMDRIDVVHGDTDLVERGG